VTYIRQTVCHIASECWSAVCYACQQLRHFTKYGRWRKNRQKNKYLLIKFV